MLVEVKFGSTSCQLNHFKPRALLGSDPASAELTVADPSVSRRHAEVYLEGDVVYVRDLGSAAGTWVNGQAVGAQPVALAPGAMVHVGQTSLGVHWPAKGSNARTSMEPPPPQLVALIQQRQQQQAAPPPAQPQYAYAPPAGYGQQGQYPPAGQYGQPAQPQYGQPAQPQYGQPAQPQYGQPAQPQYGQPAAAPPAAAPASAPPAAVPAGAPAAYQAQQTQQNAATGVAATVGVGGTSAPLPAELTYRRQGGNDNGTLLIALPGDTFANESTLDGYLEYTATDSETVVSVIIELIEFHAKGPKKGHVWDRCLVRQGPWKTARATSCPCPSACGSPRGPP